MRDAGFRHESQPPDRFYWALVDAQGWGRCGPVPEGLREAVGDELPVPANDVWAVCAPARDGALLVCAAPRARLAGVDADVITLAPSSLPGFAGGSCQPADLNLLVGEFEPRVVRRARRRAAALVAGSVVLCALLVSVGLVRRAHAWRSEAQQASAAAHQIARAALPSGGDLRTEIDRLRRSLHTGEHGRPADASLVLASILGGWPAQVPCSAQSIAINEGGATVSLAVVGDPTPFLEAIRPPPGWVLDEPRLNASGDATRVSLRLRPEKGASQ